MPAVVCRRGAWGSARDWPSPLGASATVSSPVLVATVSWAELSEVAPTTAATRAITKIHRNWLCFIACGY